MNEHGRFQLSRSINSETNKSLKPHSAVETVKVKQLYKFDVYIFFVGISRKNIKPSLIKQTFEGLSTARI